MMSIGIIGSGRGVNGVANMVAQSEVNTDAILRIYNQYINAGYCSAIALAQAYEDTGISEDSLTDFDKERIKRRIEATGGYYNNFNWR